MKVKKFLIVGTLLLAAIVAYAAVNTNIRGVSGCASRIINVGVTSGWTTPSGQDKIDTSKTAIVDTVWSDTVDISALSETSKGVWYAFNIGTVSLCDSCNDSLILIYQPYLISNGGYSAKNVRTDTFAITGIAASTAITSLDDASEYHYIPADSLYGTKIYFRTIIKDALLHTFTDTLADAAGRRMTIPMNIDVLYR